MRPNRSHGLPGWRSWLVAAWLVVCSDALPSECLETARVVSMQGTVELRRTAAAGWLPAQSDQRLCAGDTLRVGARSRAALRLANESQLRLDQFTTLTLAPVAGRVVLIDLLHGAVNVLTRTPKPFNVRTPILNAGVEGTEFLVRVEDNAARVVVFEGKVTVSSSQGTVALGAGEEATADAGVAALRRSAVVRPIDAVQWALHYPSVVGVSQASEPAVRQAYALARAGHIDRAVALLNAIPGDNRSVNYSIYRAELLLLAGRVDEARVAIAAALERDVGSSAARALLAIIAVVQNEPARAFELATAAVASDRGSAAAWIALSYAHQARFDHEAASAAARTAADLAPESPAAWARLAEMRMAHGDVVGALAAARRGTNIEGESALVHTVIGFASLAQLDVQSAQEAFVRAIELDQGDPLPRLGSGLIDIRRGRLASGRAAIEIAAALDPLNSLVRSYLGKAYLEEQRDALAGTQWGIARQLDPLDPTPHFYDAIRKQAANRPLEAVDDFQRSIDLNGNRITSRSRLLIDQDLAARQASQARAFKALGFDQLALNNAAKSLSVDFGDHAAHQLLAEAYERLPRHDLASRSEALQAELRRPVAAPQPTTRLVGENAFQLQDLSPFRTGAGEYGSLLDVSGPRLYADAVVGDRGTRGSRLLIGGANGPLAYSLGHLRFETAGFEGDNPVERGVYDLLMKTQLQYGHTLTFDAKRTELSLDDVYARFDPAVAYGIRTHSSEDSVGLGGHHVLGASTSLLWHASHAHEAVSSRSLPDLGLYDRERVAKRALESQLLSTFGAMQVVTGFSATLVRERFEGGGTIASRASATYAYARWTAAPSLAVHAGLAGERFRIFNDVVGNEISRRRTSPKLGVEWSPSADTKFRLASLSNVRRPLLSSRTLEPTQVVGFNQFYSGFKELYGDLDGSITHTQLAAFDTRLHERTYLGASAARRKLTVPAIFLEEDFTWRERSARLYGYHALTGFPSSRWQTGLSLDYEQERSHRPHPLTGPAGIINLRTAVLPLRARLFYGESLALGISATHVRQNGDFSLDTLFPVFNKRDRAWIADVDVQLQLPWRRGAVNVGIRNLFDRSLDIYDTDPLRPRFATRRLIYVSLSLVPWR
jgi:tetratricopeptide (TPR) repeat protein